MKTDFVNDILTNTLTFSSCTNSIWTRWLSW